MKAVCTFVVDIPYARRYFTLFRVYTLRRTQQNPDRFWVADDTGDREAWGLDYDGRCYAVYHGLDLLATFEVTGR